MTYIYETVCINYTALKYNFDTLKIFNTRKHTQNCYQLISLNKETNKMVEFFSSH